MYVWKLWIGACLSIPNMPNVSRMKWGTVGSINSGLKDCQMKLNLWKQSFDCMGIRELGIGNLSDMKWRQTIGFEVYHMGTKGN